MTPWDVGVPVFDGQKGSMTPIDPFKSPHPVAGGGTCNILAGSGQAGRQAPPRCRQAPPPRCRCLGLRNSRLRHTEVAGWDGGGAPGDEADGRIAVGVQKRRERQAVA